MRSVDYTRHEFHRDPECRTAVLSTLVYDIPYFGGCGIFPPFHIANQVFASGGSQGGMSPGATWQPFQLSRTEYEELVRTIRNLDPKELGEDARFVQVKFECDGDFDHIQDWATWLAEVCKKHREAFLRKQNGA